MQEQGGPSQLLRARATERPHRTALVDGSLDGRARLTWAQADTAVSAAAAALVHRGLADGDRVGLQLRTGSRFVLLYLAVLRAGLVAVPLNPSYTEREIEHIRDDAGVALVLDETSGAALLEAAPAADDPGRDRSGEHLAVLLYTSGTSGPGRGAMLPVRALRANVDQLAAVDPPLLGGEDVLFVPLPLSHVFGLNAGLGMALRVGATLVLTDHFDAGASLATMAAEGVTTVLGVPGQYAAWAAHPRRAEGFAAVRFAMSGAATLARGLVAEYAEAGVVLHDGYGLTEASPVVSIDAVGPDRDHPVAGSVGHPLPGIELELRDLEGEPVEDGDPGRIFLRGANLFTGYWPDGSGGPDGDGWFGTGDIALRGSRGELHLVGRSTDTVVVNGFNVYPAEVEAVLGALDDVAEVAVVGVADPERGERVEAYVVPRPGTSPDPAGLLAAAARSLARFKLPSRIEIVAGLPRTVTGKIMKWQLDGNRPRGNP